MHHWQLPADFADRDLLPDYAFRTAWPDESIGATALCEPVQSRVRGFAAALDESVGVGQQRGARAAWLRSSAGTATLTPSRSSAGVVGDLHRSQAMPRSRLRAAPMVASGAGTQPGVVPSRPADDLVGRHGAAEQVPLHDVAPVLDQQLTGGVVLHSLSND